MLASRPLASAVILAVAPACGCAGAPAPPPRAPEPVAAPAAEPMAEPEPEPEPEPKPKVIIHRYHVYARIKARWRKVVRVLCLMQTSRTEKLEEGTQGVLQRELEQPGPDGLDWVPVADVRVTRIGKGGHTRLEILSEHPEAKKKGKGNPWIKGTRVRLQIDRREETGG